MQPAAMQPAAMKPAVLVRTARTRAPALPIALSIVLVSACAAPPPTGWDDDKRSDGSPDDVRFTLEMGTGGWAGFAPHEEGAPLHLERGLQGGQHVTYSLRARGLPAPVYAEAVTRLVDVESGAPLDETQSLRIVLEEPYPGLYDAPPEGVMEALGMLYLVADPQQVLGREAELSIELTLEDGRIAHASMTGTVRWLGE